jgi:general secretion pathway protein L
MNKQILGLDINASFLAAVVLDLRGKERHIVSCASIEHGPERSLAESISLLLEKISWKGGSCACGISPAPLSIRNLAIPFADRKKISQVLSFELEDQLIAPVTRHIIEYVRTGEAGGTSNILVAAVEKEWQAGLFAAFDENDIDPVVLGISIASLAEQSLQISKADVDTIFLDAGLQGMNLLLSRNGEIVFLRRLAYPELMVTDPPFNIKGDRAEIVDVPEARESFRHICGDIRRSLGFFTLESGIDFTPRKIVITGKLGLLDEVRNTIESELDAPVAMSNLREEAGILLSPAAGEHWQPVVHDRALALALEGRQKRHRINFRKEEFARSQMLFTSRGRLLAAALAAALFLGMGLAYLAYDYHTLKTRYDELGGRMRSVFLETFPERTRVRDPLLEMQASIRNIQAPSVAIPVFTGSKRSLDILADISGRVPQNIQIQVSRLVIDQESVQVKGTTNTFNNVNIIQNNLRRSTLFRDVDIISAAADKDSRMIRFELRLETAQS